MIGLLMTHKSIDTTVTTENGKKPVDLTKDQKMISLMN